MTEVGLVRACLLDHGRTSEKMPASQRIRHLLGRYTRFSEQKPFIVSGSLLATVGLPAARLRPASSLLIELEVVSVASG